MRLIDADALHREFIDFIRASNNKTPNWNDAVSLVGSAPTVDAVQVKQGRWIKCTHHHWEDRYECSKCGYDTEVDTVMEKPIYNFCPYCGARMDGKSGEEDAEA